MLGLAPAASAGAITDKPAATLGSVIEGTCSTRTYCWPGQTSACLMYGSYGNPATREGA
jgi:hypothetical protein